MTALPPVRGFIKPQDFVEFRALASTQGIALQPLADDLQVEVVANNVVIGRPSGLTLSGGGASARGTAAYRRMVLDPQLWGFDRQANLTERQHNLITLLRTPARPSARRRVTISHASICRATCSGSKGARWTLRWRMTVRRRRIRRAWSCMR